MNYSASANGQIVKVLLVPGLPQPWLSPEANPGYKKIRSAYEAAAKELAASDAELILYYSTQWLSVLGYTFQGDPAPEWIHVDHNFHDLGSLPYKFKVDAEFASLHAEEVKKDKHTVRVVNYRAFPIDTGTIIAQNFLNPGNRLPAAMLSCNMYAEKSETIGLGRATARAIARSGKKVAIVLVSSLSHRFFVKEVAAANDHISSAKDDEWNQKICELLGEGRLEDVAQVARDFAREANGDMGFKGIWWLSGATGEHNDFSGKVYGYAPIYGTGAAVASLTPTRELIASMSETGGANDSSLKSSSPAGSIKKSSAATKVIHSHSAPEPVGAYPHARREGEFLFLSGVGPRQAGKKEIPGVTLDAQGKIISYDISKQTHAVMQNVKTILESAGSSFEKIVDVQVFLTNMEKDFPTYNKIYAEYFSQIQATRTTIEINRLPTPIAIELKVIAKI